MLYLRLVTDTGTRADKEYKPRFERTQELPLRSGDRTLALCTADGLDESVLAFFIRELRPHLVFDYRTTPRFDFGQLNRIKVLDLFDDMGAVYKDYGRSLADIGPETESLVKALSNTILASDVISRAVSVLVFVDSAVEFEKAGIDTIANLRTNTNGTWELCLFGRITPDDNKRRLLFISHANPEDNEFALWLQSQLTRLGYATWADVTQLSAGQTFWDTIEDVIRNQAFRVIAVTSKSAVKKPGVLDEISLAVSVERTKSIPGFVIPLRLDDIPFSEFRANIHRKHALDFHSSGWADGLSRLHDTLIRDEAPKTDFNKRPSLSTWWEQRRPQKISVKNQPEILLSNRYPAISLPNRIYTYTGAPEGNDSLLAVLIPFRGMWISYLSDRELKIGGAMGLVRESVLSAPEVFDGTASLTSSMSRDSRQRLLHRLLNAHWELFLRSKGLRLYSETGRRPLPYIPDELLSKNTAQFIDKGGKSRRRILVGYSAKRNVFWHLAPMGVFATTTRTALGLKLRIVFSEDGNSTWPSVDRMRTLRRSFCRNWWNDRWLSLQLAFFGWLAAEYDSITLHTGDGGSLVLSSSPEAYQTPLSIQEESVDLAPNPESALEDPNRDDVDWPEPDEDADLDDESIESHS